MGRFRISANSKSDAVIVELFFDGDRNEFEKPSTRSSLWRILVWKTEVGEDEIDPDAPYLDARPGQKFSFTDGHREAHEIARALRTKSIVYFNKIVPASAVLDKKTELGHAEPRRHRVNGEAGEEWEPSPDCKRGLSESYEIEDTTLS